MESDNDNIKCFNDGCCNEYTGPLSDAEDQGWVFKWEDQTDMICPHCAHADLLDQRDALAEALEEAIGIVECWQARNDQARARGDAKYQQASEFCQTARAALDKARGKE